MTRAPSSEQEAKEKAAEVEARPRQQAVENRMRTMLDDPAETPRRRVALELLISSFGVDLPGDISQAEHDAWMAFLDGRKP